MGLKERYEHKVWSSKFQTRESFASTGGKSAAETSSDSSARGLKMFHTYHWSDTFFETRGETVAGKRVIPKCRNPRWACCAFKIKLVLG